MIFSKPTRADAGTSFPNNVCFTVLAARPHALRPCARLPRGCHFNWLWPCVMLRASTPQLSARPRPRSGCVESMGDRLRSIPARNRTRSGACMMDAYMRTAPTLILLDGGPSQDTWADVWSDEAIKARRRPPRDPASRHPCRQAAFFLPCTRPPDLADAVQAAPGLQGHMHSEGRIFWRASRHFIRRATSFHRPLHSSRGY